MCVRRCGPPMGTRVRVRPAASGRRDQVCGCRLRVGSGGIPETTTGRSRRFLALRPLTSTLPPLVAHSPNGRSGRAAEVEGIAAIV